MEQRRKEREEGQLVHGVPRGGTSKLLQSATFCVRSNEVQQEEKNRPMFSFWYMK